MNTPGSALTLQRPDIWLRAVDLARGLTGYTYARKDPLPDGTIYACGGGGLTWPETPKERKERERLEEEERRRKEEPTLPECDEEIAEIDEEINSPEFQRWKDLPFYRNEIARLKSRKDWLKKRRKGLTVGGPVYVPDGAMEWLLHEVGHYVAATPDERLLPNYGLLGDDDPHSAEREWQAWAFEEVILAPYGPARHFAPPSQRDGVGFSRGGPIDERHLRHIEREMSKLHVEFDEWRPIYGEWIVWLAIEGAQS